jgi:hypothetical protein
MIYDGFQIQVFRIQNFGAGRALWHARIRRADGKPLIIDGVSFPELEAGSACSDSDVAIADAKTRVDYFNQRSANVEPTKEDADARIQPQRFRRGAVQLSGL